LKLILHAELIPKIGGKCRVSEIRKKRKLTAEMNRNLAVRLNLSTKILVRHYPLNPKTIPAETILNSFPDKNPDKSSSFRRDRNF